jgi:hypothetical protein
MGNGLEDNVWLLTGGIQSERASEREREREGELQLTTGTVRENMQIKQWL